MEEHKGENMDINTRLTNLENLVESLINTINDRKFYTDADINGVRQNVNEVSQKMNEAIYPSWNPDKFKYFAGEKVSCNGEYYRCIQEHTSQADWSPDVAVSLWARTSDPTEEWPDWVQPTGAHDAYQKGDKVSHNEKHWISDVDGNVWEPGVYGWTES